MKRALAAIALVATLAGCANDDSAFVGGRYGPDAPLVIRRLTVDSGRYTVGFSMSLRVVGSTTGATVACAIVDTSGSLNRVQPEPDEVVADNTWSRIEYAGAFSLPDVSLALRCTPSVPGSYSVTVRRVLLYATPEP